MGSREADHYIPIVPNSWSLYMNVFDFGNKSKEFWRGKNVLDIGCGVKLDSPEKFCPQAKVYVIDPQIGKKIPPPPGCEFRVGTAQAIPYDDNAFDIICSLRLLFHISDKEKSLALVEMVRVLNPGGEIHISPCRLNTMNYFHNVFKERGFRFSHDGYAIKIKSIHNSIQEKNSSYRRIHNELLK